MSSLWKAAYLFSLFASALGQRSNVVCSDAYDWAFNDRNQSPCLVSSYLQSGCGTIVSVDLIPEGTHYSGPNATRANVCNCNTVVYSLTAACGACQGRTVANWTTWVANCPPTFRTIADFPNEIPEGTVVPRWAYINVTELPEQRWNAARARQEAAESETPSSTPNTPTSESLPPISQSTFNSEQTSKPTQGSESAGKSNAGAIAGGIVGGLVGLVALGLAIFWFLLRKKRKDETSPPRDFVIDDGASHAPLAASSPPPSSPPPMTMTSQSGAVSPMNPNFYNTSFDTGYFPAASPPPASVIQTTITTRRSQESLNASQFGTQIAPPSQVSSSQARGYTGVAEV
ncbi:hypothetical protein CC1G_01127 [Coprinopsis cinerea okayama7|uniref:Transmembrane protein n=1 Tax=Coprinopsis cinerea (strain Okayama-7 / 130 / ATCC MYA-4618 / FGSC 9003) TaxID=240176 RepID=A8NEL5_COPC7|nr:hypothetical protein CC1G_01127 [Coprinopsis cinerea okayama7\|eukprot:XP_001833065.2 hypothetical protein CC1G_01127 [Coprinopsis cinerea okayama7\